MSITLKTRKDDDNNQLEYKFEGPYTNIENIKDNSGVYAILRKNPDGKYTVIDIGESSTVKSRLDNHDRYECWQENCSDLIFYAVHYTLNKQKTGRVSIEKELRKAYRPICGIR